MSVLAEPLVSASGRQFFRHAYEFVHRDWQHANRDESADQGFEKQFRASCAMNGLGWAVSENREMSLGLGLGTASGVSHEIDIILRALDSMAIFELKNKGGVPFDKNDAIVFFAKVLDYLCATPDLCLQEINLILLSSSLPDTNGIAACLGLGIHPIAPSLRPLPYLQFYALDMERQLNAGLRVPKEQADHFSDFAAELNRMLLALDGVWPASRWGVQSENSIVVRRVAPIDLDNIPFRLVSLNKDFGLLLDAFKAARTAAE